MNGGTQGTEVRLRFVDIVAREEAGETRAQVTLERIGDYLGIGIGNIISGLGIGQIVVSGRIVFGWKFIESHCTKPWPVQWRDG